MTRTLTGAAIIVTLVAVAARSFSDAPKSDRDLPEAETFLLLAAENMASFHKDYHAYAREWYRLGFDYAYPTYRITDADIWPRPADKDHWKPRGSHYTYVIVEATTDAFLIRAIDDHDKVAYEIRQGLDAPKKVE